MTRSLLSFVVLAACAILGAKQLSHLLDDPSILPPDDFVEYWAAGKLNLAGRDPYLPDNLLPMQRDQTARREADGSPLDKAVMMWNPPWTLTFVMPLGALEARPAQLLWLVLTLCVTVFAADRVWKHYGGSSSLRWVSWLLALGWLPSLFNLHAGQISGLILLGLVGFLHFRRTGKLAAAGACGVLLAIKPHLVYLFWLWLLRTEARRGWKILVGGIIAGVACTLIPLVYNPSVIEQYRTAVSDRPPEEWISPTWGTVLRMMFGEDRFRLQFVPVVFGVVWALMLTRKPTATASAEWDERLPLLVLVSVVFASYGAWPFDLVILLLPIVSLAAKLSRGPQKWRTWGLAAFVSIDAGMLALNVGGVRSFWFIWVAPAVLIAYSLLERRVSRDAK